MAYSEKKEKELLENVTLVIQCKKPRNLFGANRISIQQNQLNRFNFISGRFEPVTSERSLDTRRHGSQNVKAVPLLIYISSFNIPVDNRVPWGQNHVDYPTQRFNIHLIFHGRFMTVDHELLSNTNLGQTFSWWRFHFLATLLLLGLTFSWRWIWLHSSSRRSFSLL